MISNASFHFPIGMSCRLLFALFLLFPLAGEASATASQASQVDFDGDGRADLGVFDPNTATWFVIPSANVNSPITQSWGDPGDVPVPADYDGDGKTDFAVWRPSNGNWYIQPSSDRSRQVIQQWGGTIGGVQDIPVPGDYDGDGIADFAVWRPSNGTFYVIRSSDRHIVEQQWGLKGDIPVPGDYDGDGKTDFAVWRPSNGYWYVILSSSLVIRSQQWGGTISGHQDVPVPGDYDGDGKTDFAVWRPSNGVWYVIPSSNPGVPYAQQWGGIIDGVQDVPMPADYDGDHKTDFAVWRPSNATAYSIASSTGRISATVLGSKGDLPLNVLPGELQNTSRAGLESINHVIFMLQENRTFDNYFGMLNQYRVANGWNIGDDSQQYSVDGLDGSKAQISNPMDENKSPSDTTTTFVPFKLSTTCTDDMSSAWLESWGDVNRFDFKPSRLITMNGFVHTAENFAKANGYFDVQGKRAMGFYDQDFLNYYYFMAANFAISDRWFSPVASKTIPNRIATMSGGTTQGLVYDPSNNDGLGSLTIPTIFQELENAGVSWKIYYSNTNSSSDPFPATSFSYFTDAQKYLHHNSGQCGGNTVPSSAVGDPSNSFCIDTRHIAPLSQYFSDVASGNLSQFVYIEPGYNDGTDEHPGGGIISGQQQVAKIISALIGGSAWKDSVFFLSYDEGGGPFDHVPPVPGHTNQYTDSSLNITSDIASIAVNPDQYNPCPLTPKSLHCDLRNYGSYADPGYNSGDAAAQQGFGAQLGFRVPNIVISPFTRKHYVSHIPMDHTAVIKFVENRFIGSGAHLTNRDAAQPNLLDFFDFNAVPWASPPANIPQPSSVSACNPKNL